MKNPTRAQKRIWAKMIELGCLPCLLDGIHGSPATISHVHEPGYRQHDLTYPACPIHHLYDHAVQGTPNRHRNPIEFQERYGTDRELCQKAMILIGEING